MSSSTEVSLSTYKTKDLRKFSMLEYFYETQARKMHFYDVQTETSL